MTPSLKAIGEAVSRVEDPEIHLSLAELGLIYGAEIEKDGKVAVVMSLTSPGCPYGPELMTAVEESVLSVPGVRNAAVDVVFDPLWDPEVMASDDAKDELGIF